MWVGRQARLFAAGICATSLMAGTATASATDPIGPPTVQSTRATVSADSLPTAQHNGVGWTQTMAPGRVIVGGTFTEARPAGVDPAGPGAVPRGNLMAYEVRTGALDASFAPVTNGAVRALTYDQPSHTIWAGGDFTQVNGVAAGKLVALDATTGERRTIAVPDVRGRVLALAIAGGALWVGGDFNAVGGVPRNHIAVVRLRDGALLNVAPFASHAVTSFTFVQPLNKMVVGGRFTTLAGSAAVGMGALDASTGRPLPWPVNTVVKNSGSSAGITSLANDGTHVYGSAFVVKNHGGNLEGSFAADAATGQLTWINDCHGDTYSVTPYQGVLYQATHAHKCDTIGAFPQLPNEFYRATALSTTATGVARPNTVYGFASFTGKPTPSMLEWMPTMPEGQFTGQIQGPWHVQAGEGFVTMTGEFPQVNGVKQYGNARFAAREQAPRKEGPTLKDSRIMLRAVGETASSARVSWTTNADRDDNVLEYTLLRDGMQVGTWSGWSPWWSRRPMTHLDTGLSAGRTYTYQLRVTDPDGNAVTSATAQVRPKMGAALGLAAREVLADQPLSWWRFPTATNAGVDWRSGNHLMPGKGTSWDAESPWNDGGSMSLTGAEGESMLQVGAYVDAPVPVTTEVWFKATESRGGTLLGLHIDPGPKSMVHDRDLFVTDDGKVGFGVFDGKVQVVAGGAKVFDGTWHHVVGSFAPGDLRVYLDGELVDHRDDVFAAKTFMGYWTLGRSNVNGWPQAPATPGLVGRVAEAAVYPSVLSPERVAAHWRAGKPQR